MRNVQLSLFLQWVDVRVAMTCVRPATCVVDLTLESAPSALSAGVKVGRNLVEEQSGVLIYLLAALADLLGTPVTEMVWIQVRFCDQHATLVKFALGRGVALTALLTQMMCGARRIRSVAT